MSLGWRTFAGRGGAGGRGGRIAPQAACVRIDAQQAPSAPPEGIGIRRQALHP